MVAGGGSYLYLIKEKKMSGEDGEATKLSCERKMERENSHYSGSVMCVAFMCKTGGE